MTHRKLKILEMRKPKFVYTIKWPQEVCFIRRSMWELSSSSRVCDYLNDPKVFSPSRYYPHIIENGWGKNPGQTPNGVFLSWHPWGGAMFQTHFLSEVRHTDTLNPESHGSLRSSQGGSFPSFPFIPTLAQEASTFQRQVSSWLAPGEDTVCWTLHISQATLAPGFLSQTFIFPTHLSLISQGAVWGFIIDH